MMPWGGALTRLPIVTSWELALTIMAMRENGLPW